MKQMKRDIPTVIKNLKALTGKVEKMIDKIDAVEKNQAKPKNAATPKKAAKKAAKPRKPAKKPAVKKTRKRSSGTKAA